MRIITVLVVVLMPLLMQAQTKFDTLIVSDDIFLVKVTEKVYVHVSYGTFGGFGRFTSNGVIYANGNDAFLFDTPVNDSITQVLVAYLTHNLHLNVVGFVPNHWHIDCMGGLGYLQRMNVTTYANQQTIDICENKGLPQPLHGFTDSLEIRFGTTSVYCYYLGSAHSTDNITVWLPDEKVLFAGCMVKSVGSQNLGNTADGDLKAYPFTLKKLLAKFTDAKLVIPGHGPFGGIELIEHTLELTKK